MDDASVSRIESWDSRSVPGGYVGLNQLAEETFTGGVAAGGTWLVMVNGRVLGVFDGDLSRFEGAEPTAFEAPDPALPLLIAMRERGGEVRGRYYTDDTPLGEVDGTLSEGGFTGYLELSENVLSGDYYVVYYGGRSLSVAFLGNTGRVVTGEEAFDLAEEEVGIYEVRAVDLEVTDVPEPSDDVGAPTAAPSADVDDDASEVASASPADEPEEEPSDDAEPVADEPAPVDGPGGAAPEDERAVDGATGEAEADGAVADDSVDDAPTRAEADALAEDSARAGTDAGAGEPAAGQAPTEPTEATDPPTTDAPGPVDREEPEPASSSESPGSGAAGARADRPTDDGPNEPGGERSGPAGDRPAGADAGAPDERFEEEARWRETRTVPALDPDESAGPEEPGDPTVEAPAARTPQPATTEPTAPTEADRGGLRERVRELEASLEASQRRRNELESRLETAVDERDRLAEERDALAERIESLEDRLEAAEAAAAASSTASGSPTASPSRSGRSLDPETALDQTDLFVRYGSKAKPTLQTAHDGTAGADEVADNLRIETHSRFDTDTATVDGRPFDAFLEATIQYRFVAWLVEELLYEIQETGTEAGLRELYDVLPGIDRAEFNGTVRSRDEAGEELRVDFDVVCRDRMGKPLVVANLNDALDPATGEMMVRLVEDGTDAAEAHESIGAAFFVTASFFEPDALETVADATRGGGILSRDSRKSFVKLARNGGYHLCLVEARGDDFHVAVPEF